MDYKNFNWEEANMEHYVSMCYPKRNQYQHIHSEDVRLLVPILKKEKPKVIVEIGASYGTSSKLFAAISKEFNGKLYSIDPNPRPEWYENLKEYSLLESTELINKASPWINWNKKIEIDFLFIDGYHNFRNVFVDFFYWTKYVKEGGMIAFHDTKKFTSVKKAINEIINTEFLEYIDASPSKVGLEIYRKIKDERGNTAFFGPWVGEFGFEVAWWQGFCRKKSREFDYTMVSTYPGNEGLYEDFANEIIPHELVGQPMCGYANGLEGEFEYPNVTKVFIPPDKKFIPHEEQEYIKFGSENPSSKYDIMIQVNEHGRKQFSNWENLLKAWSGLKMACYGKTGKWSDGYLEETDDLRDLPVKELVKYLAGSKVVIGPGSGAMHLASYCGSNIVIWGDRKTYTWGQTMRQRYEKILNPFNSPVIVLDDWDYEPPIEEIVNAVARFL